MPDVTTAGVLIASRSLGASFEQSSNPDQGAGGNPNIGSGGNPNVGSGGNPNVGSGGNPNVGSGGNPNVGSGGNPNVGSGGNPNVGSGGNWSPVTIVVHGTCSSTPRVGPGFPFRIDDQQESHWCWAAVASGIDRYYSPKPFLSQCDVASDLFDTDACSFPDDWNEGEALEDVLSTIGRLGPPQAQPKPTFDSLKTEIDAHRPVAVFIQWDQDHGHFVTICGYSIWSNGLTTIDVADPFYPDSTEVFDEFPASYHGGGIWQATYLTK